MFYKFSASAPSLFAVYLWSPLGDAGVLLSWWAEEVVFRLQFGWAALTAGPVQSFACPAFGK